MKPGDAVILDAGGESFPAQIVNVSDTHRIITLVFEGTLHLGFCIINDFLQVHLQDDGITIELLTRSQVTVRQTPIRLGDHLDVQVAGKLLHAVVSRAFGLALGLEFEGIVELDRGTANGFLMIYQLPDGTWIETLTSTIVELVLSN